MVDNLSTSCLPLSTYVIVILSIILQFLINTFPHRFHTDNNVHPPAVGLLLIFIFLLDLIPSPISYTSSYTIIIIMLLLLLVRCGSGCTYEHILVRLLPRFMILLLLTDRSSSFGAPVAALTSGRQWLHLLQWPSHCS